MDYIFILYILYIIYGKCAARLDVTIVHSNASNFPNKKKIIEKKQSFQIKFHKFNYIKPPFVFYSNLKFISREEKIYVYI